MIYLKPWKETVVSLEEFTQQNYPSKLSLEEK
jgi:hypothetical protein